MKYVSVNELDTFYFHDAIIENAIFENDNMIWSVTSLNVTTDNPHNDFSTDMRIESAKITFENVIVTDITEWGYKSYDPETGEEETVAPLSIAPSGFDDYLKQYLETNIFGMEKVENGNQGLYTACFSINGIKVFNITFTYSKAIVEWDGYCGKPWYLRD